MKNDFILICPICGQALRREGSSLFCAGERRHCYDVASSGYVNLCPGRATGGDDAALVRARSNFLRAGYYKPISDRICEILASRTGCESIIDAGCGEGYYTVNIASATGADVYGFDLSKEGINSAAKYARRQGVSGVGFFVGGIFDLPVADASADAVVNIFAPCAEEEFSRVLRSGGILVEAVAGKNHLYGLKRALYDEVYVNEARVDMPERMRLISKESVAYEMTLESAEAVMNLFSMTPYYYRTKESDVERLRTLGTLTTEVEVDIYVYERN